MCAQGQQQTVLFCGDGLNDLAALGTAEVGMAIGPIDAMAAAPVSTKHSSIAGWLAPLLLSVCFCCAAVGGFMLLSQRISSMIPKCHTYSNNMF